MSEIELKARELYAAALRDNGMDFTAERVLQMIPEKGVGGSVRATIDAIKAALEWRYENSGVLQWDDASVDAFAMSMKAKMAASRAKGRGGWEDPEQCSADDLSRMLREHVEKGDPVDVANFCMMLGQRGESIASLLQWQPIESAPKDGRTIIGYSAAVGEPMLVRFIAPHEFLTTGECEMKLNVPDFGALKEVEEWLYREAWFYADFVVGDICDSACQPTHWQPLPAPPEVSA